jgi:tRNA-dihydrouridine synthase
MFLHYGEPDLYVSEFLRVHATSTIDRSTMEILTKRSSVHPIFIQLLGREPADISRIAGELTSYDIAGININFGCPMAKICRKGVGGSLLNDPERMDRILTEVEREVTAPLSVKIRTGFDSALNFGHIIGVLAGHKLSFVAVHARTVRALYWEAVDYDQVRLAKNMLGCRVFANGDINSAQRALDVAKLTHCDGVMIGRAAVRNPFIFRQIRELQAGEPCFVPKFSDLHAYVLQLIDAVGKRTSDERGQVGALKKYLSFVGQGVDERGEFLRQMRHATDKLGLISAIDLHIGGRGDECLRGDFDCRCA